MESYIIFVCMRHQHPWTPANEEWSSAIKIIALVEYLMASLGTNKFLQLQQKLEDVPL